MRHKTPKAHPGTLPGRLPGFGDMPRRPSVPLRKPGRAAPAACGVPVVDEAQYLHQQNHKTGKTGDAFEGLRATAQTGGLALIFPGDMRLAAMPNLPEEARPDEILHALEDRLKQAATADPRKHVPVEAMRVALGRARHKPQRPVRSAPGKRSKPPLPRAIRHPQSRAGLAGGAGPTMKPAMRSRQCRSRPLRIRPLRIRPRRFWAAHRAGVMGQRAGGAPSVWCSAGRALHRARTGEPFATGQADRPGKGGRAGQDGLSAAPPHPSGASLCRIPLAHPSGASLWPSPGLRRCCGRISAAWRRSPAHCASLT